MLDFSEWELRQLQLELQQIDEDFKSFLPPFKRIFF